MNKLRRWLIEKLGGTVWTPETGIREVYRRPAVCLRLCHHFPAEVVGALVADALGENFNEVALERFERDIGHAIVKEKLYDLYECASGRGGNKVYEMEVWVVPPKGREER